MNQQDFAMALTMANAQIQSRLASEKAFVSFSTGPVVRVVEAQPAQQIHRTLATFVFIG